MDKDFYTVRAYEHKLYDGRLLTPSMEDYVEMIYRSIQDGEEHIRLNKLADLLNVRNSSASKMMQKLGKQGLINYEKYGMITLTELGIKTGSYLLMRHNIIESFLRLLGSSEDLLIETELIEHIVSSNTVENLKVFNAFMEENPEVLNGYKAFRNEYFLR